MGQVSAVSHRDDSFACNNQMGARLRLYSVYMQDNFTHQYLLKSVLSQGQMNYMYWCLVYAGRALGRSGCGSDGLAVCWPGRRG